MWRHCKADETEDNLLAEARNLRLMTATQTPLLGEENTPMPSRGINGTGFESATPRAGVTATPNPLATPRAGGVLQTPRTIAGVGATPRSVRDSLSINDDYAVYGQTPQNEKQRLKAARKALQAGFASLPQPENNFELAETEEDEEEPEEQFLSEEDAAERDAKMKAAREREEQLELARRSSVVKRGLPRPIAVDPMALLTELNSTIEETDALSEALRAVNLEVALLMRHDSLAHPLPGSSTPGVASDYDMPEDEYVDHARKAIHSELAGSIGLPGATEEQVKLVIRESIDDEAVTDSWATEREKMVLDPQTRTWVDADSLSPEALTAAYQHMILLSKERMIADATRASKAEKKLAKQLGGYQALNAKARKGILDVMEEIQAAQRELETFRMLRAMEEAAAPSRLEKQREEVGVLEKRERDLQARYAEINDERRALVDSIEQVSWFGRLRRGGYRVLTPSLRRTRSSLRRRMLWRHRAAKARRMRREQTERMAWTRWTVWKSRHRSVVRDEAVAVDNHAW
jgi:pre-mRNA-splicing factor CDC5/CEF1